MYLLSSFVHTDSCLIEMHALSRCMFNLHLYLYLYVRIHLVTCLCAYFGPTSLLLSYLLTYYSCHRGANPHPEPSDLGTRATSTCSPAFLLGRGILTKKAERTSGRFYMKNQKHEPLVELFRLGRDSPLEETRDSGAASVRLSRRDQML